MNCSSSSDPHPQATPESTTDFIMSPVLSCLPVFSPIPRREKLDIPINAFPSEFPIPAIQPKIRTSAERKHKTRSQPQVNSNDVHSDVQLMSHDNPTRCLLTDEIPANRKKPTLLREWSSLAWIQTHGAQWPQLKVRVRDKPV